MGFLIVLEGDHQATGPRVDLSKAEHREMVQLAISVPGGFPLVRRMKEYYRDAEFDADEVAGLQQELKKLAKSSSGFQSLVHLVETALKQEKGLDAISD